MLSKNYLKTLFMFISVVFLVNTSANSNEIKEHNIENLQRGVYKTNGDTIGKTIDDVFNDFNRLALKVRPELVIPIGDVKKQSIQNLISSMSTKEALAMQSNLDELLGSSSQESQVLSAADVVDVSDLAYLVDDLGFDIMIYNYKYTGVSASFTIVVVSDEEIKNDVALVILESKYSTNARKHAEDLTYLYIILSYVLSDQPDKKKSLELVSNTFRQLKQKGVSEIIYDSITFTTYTRQDSVTETIIKPL